jgi:MOSC domain-containing protein YiiM
MTGRLLSLQIGKPQALPIADGRTFVSAIAKLPIADGVRVAIVGENLEGDQQANRRYHGGPDKVLCGYSAEHYPLWQAELGLELPFGAFGENLTVDGLTEDVLCIGDILTVGSATIQISQPRQPCVNVARRWGVPSLPRQMEATGRTGFYARIVTAGAIAAGDPITRSVRPYPEFTIARANRVMYGTPPDPAAVEALRAVEALSAEWRRILARRLARPSV